MSDTSRLTSAVGLLLQANNSAYNATLIVATATVTVTPSAARLAGIYAMTSTTGTTSVTGFRAENGSAVSITIVSAVSGPVLQPARPMFVTNLIVNTNTAADARKLLFVWKSADNG